MIGKKLLSLKDKIFKEETKTKEDVKVKEIKVGETKKTKKYK